MESKARHKGVGKGDGVLEGFSYFEFMREIDVTVLSRVFWRA
jgi:hypothetical protein